MNRPKREWPFYAGLIVAAAGSVLLIVGMLLAILLEASPDSLLDAVQSPAIQAAAQLSLLSSSFATLLSLWVGVPVGFLLARVNFWGRTLLELITEIPLILPPTVVGLGLLLLSQTDGFKLVTGGQPVAYTVPAVVLAQFVLTSAFITHGSKLIFLRQSPRSAALARTLGCTAGQAFCHVTLLEARRELAGLMALGWARAIGEFGPVIVFAGAARFRTEVLPTTIYLELSSGNLAAACAVSAMMMVLGLTILIVVRLTGGPP